MMRGRTTATVRTLACAALLAVTRPFSAAAWAQSPDGSGPAEGLDPHRASPITPGAERDPQRPFAAFSASASSLRDSVVALARAQVGRRYRYGGQSPDRGFDCSGFVRYVLAALSLDVPRTAAQLERTGIAVERDTSGLRPGDLLTFGAGRKASHVGIYIGNGRYIHASSKAGRVIESPIDRAPHPLIKQWRGARRIVVTPDSVRVVEQVPLAG
jgi:cell wall-associated NlpC family hydrolase